MQVSAKKTLAFILVVVFVTTYSAPSYAYLQIQPKQNQTASAPEGQTPEKSLEAQSAQNSQIENKNQAMSLAGTIQITPTPGMSLPGIVGQSSTPSPNASNPIVVDVPTTEEPTPDPLPTTVVGMPETPQPTETSITYYDSGKIKQVDRKDGSSTLYADELLPGGEQKIIYEVFPDGTARYIWQYWPNSSQVKVVTTYDGNKNVIATINYFASGQKSAYYDHRNGDVLTYFDENSQIKTFYDAATEDYTEFTYSMDMSRLESKKVTHLDKSYETYEYWPNGQIHFHKKFDSNNNPIDSKEYDENGKEIIPVVNPQVDKATILTSFKQSLLQVLGMSASDHWFFDLNNDGVLDRADVNVLDNWDALTPDQMSQAFARIWGGLQEHIHGHPNSVHCQCMMHLDFNGDGVLDRTDLKLMQDRLPTPGLQIPLAAAIKVLDAQYDGLALAGPHDHEHMDMGGEAQHLSPVTPIIQALVMINPNLNLYKVIVGSNKITTEYEVLVGSTKDEEVFLNRPSNGMMGELGLVKLTEATNAIIRSGNWSDASIWTDGKIPAVGAKIWIPAGVSVTYDVNDTQTKIETVRVDGKLTFNPHVNTGLKVVTMVISGVLQIGDVGERVDADKKAEIIFAGRGPRNKTYDPKDLSGGLIVHGQVLIYGAEHTSFAQSQTPLLAGVDTLQFAEAQKDWKVGDELVIAVTKYEEAYTCSNASDPSNCTASGEEKFTIVGMSADGRTIKLNRKLGVDRITADGVAVPIGNVTRNVAFRSEKPDQIDQRGHIMIMHEPSVASIIDGAEFYELGRTDGDIPIVRSNVWEPNPTGTNTVGRYAVHFHNPMNNPTGNSYDNPPQIFRNSAIVGSPKLGLANHGDYVLATDNVAYNIDGSAFFTENGSEIGSFERNLAVTSKGSGLPQHTESRYRWPVQDFGHSGHGFWLQSGGVVLKDNFAFGQRSSAYALGTWTNTIEFGGNPPEFKVDNLRFIADQSDDAEFKAQMEALRQKYISQGITKISIEDVPYFWSGNVAASSGMGAELIEYHGGASRKEIVYSIIKDMTIWNVAGGSGIDLEYVNRLKLTNIRVEKDSTKFYASGYGIETHNNGATGDILMDNIYVNGFQRGVYIPVNGKNSLTHAYINSWEGIFGSRPIPYRTFEIDDVTFGPDTLTAVNLWLNSVEERLDRSFHDESVITMKNVKYAGTSEWAKQNILALEGKRIFFEDQSTSATPVMNSDIPEINGLTAQQIWDKYHLAAGGGIPRNMSINAFALHAITGDIEEESYEPLSIRNGNGKEIWTTNQYENFVAHIYDSEGHFVMNGPAVTLKDGWNFISVTVKNLQRTIVVYGDKTPPSVENMEFLRPSNGVDIVDRTFYPDINPLDVDRVEREGFWIPSPVWWDSVAGVPQRYSAERSWYAPVRVIRNAKGEPIQVIVSFEIWDDAGNTSTVHRTLTVSASAPRR